MSPTVLIDELARSLRPMTYAQLIARASDNWVTGAIRRGELVRLMPDQYTLALHADSWELRARAALAWAGRGAMLAGTSALIVRGAADPGPTVAIAAPWTDRPRGPGWLRVRRYVEPPRPDLVRGFRAAPVAHAVVQAHVELPPGCRAEAVFRPLRKGLVTAGEIAEVARTRPRITARAELMRRLESAASGAESHLEDEGGAAIMRGPEFAAVIRQHWVVADGSRFRLDAFDPRSLTALEFDGSHHDQPDQRRADCVRDALLAREGIQTLRFAYPDVMGRPDWCRDVAAGVIRARLTGGGPAGCRGAGM